MPDRDPTRNLQDELNLILANPALRGARLTEAVGGTLSRRCADPYRTVLQCAASIDLPEAQARAAMTAIEQQRSDMEALLGRDPGFPVAALTWLHEVENRLPNPGFRGAGGAALTTGGSGTPAAIVLDLPEEEEARRGERYNRPFSCVMLAPDEAAAAGRDALVSAASRVRESARDVDQTRATPDAIRVVLPCTAGEGARVAAERWRRVLCGATGLGWSAGVASSPRPVREAHTVAALAGEAMRSARLAGGDRTAAYRPEKRAHARRPVGTWLAGELRVDERGTPAVIEDLSLGGALLGTSEALVAGSDVMLAVRDTSVRPRTVVMASRIERCAAGTGASATRWRTAVAFRGDAEARQHLARLIADLPVGPPADRAGTS